MWCKYLKKNSYGNLKKKRTMDLGRPIWEKQFAVVDEMDSRLLNFKAVKYYLRLIF